MDAKQLVSTGSRKTYKIHCAIIASAICGFFTIYTTRIIAADTTQPQGPGWVAQPSAEELADQQRMLTRAYLAQQSQKQRLINNRQEEVLKIYDKDPWRKVKDRLNYVGDEGWVQFQGVVQAIEPTGILFRGKFGTVLTIRTENDQDAVEVTTTRHERPSSVPGYEPTVTPQKSYSRPSQQSGSRSSVEVIRLEVKKKVYGEDYFMVLNYPYPAEIEEGIERMMAYDAGYITYTNSARRVLTVRKLDYGIPTIKEWTQAEIAAAKKQLAEEQAIIEAAQKAEADARAKLWTEQEQAKARQAEEIRKAEEARRQVEIERQNTAIANAVKKDQDEVALGDVWAMRRLAARYRDGNGVEKDLNKAEEYFKKAEATENAAIRKLNEEQRLREIAAKQQRVASLQAQASNGSINAMVALGKCYRDGDGVEKDVKKAKEIFQKAAGTLQPGVDTVKARLQAAELALTCE